MDKRGEGNGGESVRGEEGEGGEVSVRFEHFVACCTVIKVDVMMVWEG